MNMKNSVNTITDVSKGKDLAIFSAFAGKLCNSNGICVTAIFINITMDWLFFGNIEMMKMLGCIKKILQPPSSWFLDIVVNYL